MPRAVAELFAHAEEQQAKGDTVAITMSFLQIYIERITDLLGASAKSLAIREDPQHGVFVEHLSAVPVASVADVLRLVREGAANRATGFTDQNQASSRSHAMLCFTIEQTSAATAAEDAATTTAETRRSTLRIVDLAGSERVSKSGSKVGNSRSGWVCMATVACVGRLTRI